MDLDRHTAELRVEWGESAVRALASSADVVVIVDVLSFSTCVDVAVARGGRVIPVSPGWPGASQLAAQHGATLAGPRGEGRYSLSPLTYLKLAPGESVVLPSPNGATATLAASSGVVLAGCLRNAPAVADAASRLGRDILVVPAGERWPDGSLRPCLEDWLGAGAILGHLRGKASSEARAAVAAYRELASELPRALQSCMSGQELIGMGYDEDVAFAAQIGASAAVPIFDEESFTGASPAVEATPR
jgi:2-phosphosulfolactate phosphatase